MLNVWVIQSRAKINLHFTWEVVPPTPFPAYWAAKAQTDWTIAVGAVFTEGTSNTSGQALDRLLAHQGKCDLIPMDFTELDLLSLGAVDWGKR